MRANNCDSVTFLALTGRPSRGASEAGRAADAGPWDIMAADPDELSANLDDVEAADKAICSHSLHADTHTCVSVVMQKINLAKPYELARCYLADSNFEQC
eukprot:GHVU01141002.1.p1 GENE.GHVU01141002.1~~GHVU01141002.1.p1  ORF type:complete len:100 (+),score=10.18 GHVU01141002.1:272-571(+)